MVLLGAIALVLSFILCIHALSGHGLIGCSAGSSCNEVLGSRWSFLLGLIPVSALATLLYLVLLVCVLLRDSLAEDPAFQKYVDSFCLFGAGAVIGSAIWFIWLQKNMIRAFCPYCMSAHVAGVCFSILIIVRRFGRDSDGLVCGKTVFKTLLCLLCGLLAAGALAATQLLTTPRTAFERGFVPEALPQCDPHQLPSYGNPDAGTVVTLLYDYRCSHCRKIHGMLPELAGLLGPDFVIVTCPVPLSLACNPYVRASEDRFEGSCELTRYALALWRTDRNAFAAFDRWLFSTSDEESGQVFVSRTGWYPRDLEQARSKAESLIGPDALAKAVKDPWIDDYLSEVMELFGRTSTAEKAAIPRFICNGQWLVPDADDADGLAALILGLAE